MFLICTEMFIPLLNFKLYLIYISLELHYEIFKATKNLNIYSLYLDVSVVNTWPHGSFTAIK